MTWLICNSFIHIFNLWNFSSLMQNFSNLLCNFSKMLWNVSNFCQSKIFPRFSNDRFRWESSMKPIFGQKMHVASNMPHIWPSYSVLYCYRIFVSLSMITRFFNESLSHDHLVKKLFFSARAVNWIVLNWTSKKFILYLEWYTKIILVKRN